MLTELHHTTDNMSFLQNVRESVDHRVFSISDDTESDMSKGSKRDETDCNGR